jgi:hypothetical protein
VKTLPRGHATLVLLEGVVPRLCGAPEVVGGEPSAVQREGALPAEEPLTLVEPVERVRRTVVGGEVDLGEPWWFRCSAAMAG